MRRVKGRVPGRKVKHDADALIDQLEAREAIIDEHERDAEQARKEVLAIPTRPLMCLLVGYRAVEGWSFLTPNSIEDRESVERMKVLSERLALEGWQKLELVQIPTDGES